jgi:hypothetical protein
MCETCMVSWGCASPLYQNQLKLFGQHNTTKGGAHAIFQIF